MSSATEQSRSRHVRVHDKCDVCGTWMSVNERFIALLGNKDSTALQAGIVAPRYLGGSLDQSSRLDVGKWQLCWEYHCWRCENAPEAAIIHQDCLQLFWRHFKAADALDRLWLAIVWRRPFARMDLHLPRYSVGSESFVLAAEQCGIPHVRLLPFELQEAIRKLTGPHLFSRYVGVLDFVRDMTLASLVSESPITVPLTEISSWERGSSLDLVTEDWPVIRVTIDFAGLKKIERLPETSNPEQGFKRRVSESVFIVEKHEYLRDIRAKFKYGICRLEVPRRDRCLQIWDTPIPPDLKRCTVRPRMIAAPMRFHTINIAATTGITFFFRAGNLVAIHAHTQSEPSARSTIERLPDWFRRFFTWVYIPLPSVDTLVAFGQEIADDTESGESFTTTSPYFLFRLLLAGDVPLGLYEPTRTGSVLLCDRPPSALIYRTDEPFPISIIMPYCDSEQTRSPRTPLIRPPEATTRRPSWHYSLARLDHVGRVQLFYDASTTFCHGILLEYGNGAQRTLGQCRLQVDPSRTYTKPSFLSFVNLVCEDDEGDEEANIEVVKVRFDDGFEQSHDQQENWLCFEMVGTLHFWFRGRQARVHVSDGGRILPPSNS